MANRLELSVLKGNALVLIASTRAASANTGASRLARRQIDKQVQQIDTCLLEASDHMMVICAQKMCMHVGILSLVQDASS